MTLLEREPTVAVEAAPGAVDAPIALSVRGLARAFGAVRAVDDLAFDIHAGEVLSIIGPNGSGKTTAINLLSGLIPLDAGRISLHGESIEHLSAERRAQLGLSRTFQNGRVFGTLPVADNVSVGLYATLHRARPLAALRDIPVLRWLALLAELCLALVQPRAVRRELDDVQHEVSSQLARFGDRLLPRAHQPAYTLSYANRRRTEIARALASRPRVLLLDEPTAGMNPTETAEVLSQLLELKAQGQTMLLVEHKIDLVLRLSDRVIVMDSGKIIAEGTPNEIRHDERVVEAYLGHRTAQRTSLPEQQAPAASTAPVLELRDVDVFYGAAQALRAVSLHVQPGEIVCLLGGNASGKSTTMKTVLGLLRPRNGHVLIDGQPADNLSTVDRVRRGVASVPEARRVFPSMTVEENLVSGAFTRGDRRAVKDDLARMYDVFPRLAERRRQLAGSFSGGEQQMLAFARALMSHPRLVCMDEPTMGLSPLFVDRVLDMIVEFNTRLGVAVLMVEQNAELALSIARRGYVLQTGAIVLEGSARSLLDNDLIRDAYLGKSSPT